MTHECDRNNDRDNDRDNDRNKHCKPCEGAEALLRETQLQLFLEHVPSWKKTDDGRAIFKKFEFKGFQKTMSFVNAVAWIAGQEGHHPELLVRFNECTVTWSTHAANGLTENDFICAQKVDLLLDDHLDPSHKEPR